MQGKSEGESAQDKRSFGKALKKVMGPDEVELETEHRPSNVSRLMNPRRLAAFMYVWEHPCAHLRQMSMATGIPLETLRWHLKVLERARILGSRKISKKRIYFPAGLIEEKDAEFFSIIFDERRCQVMRSMGAGESSLPECAGRLRIKKGALYQRVKLLKNAGLLEAQRKDNIVLIRPGGKFLELKEYYDMRKDRVLKWLLAMLEKDCLAPRAIEKSDNAARIRLSLGTEKRILDFSLNPIANIF